MDIINSLFRYSAALLFGMAAWLALIAIIVILSYWDSVLEYLLGN